MIDIRDKVFGVLLNLDKNQQYEFVNNLRPEWFENNFHTAIFKGVQAIKNENRYIDTVSIIKWLREANLLEKDFMIKITNLVAQAELTDILAFVQGPDYPTEAEIITPKADIRKMYETLVLPRNLLQSLPHES